MKVLLGICAVSLFWLAFGGWGVLAVGFAMYELWHILIALLVVVIIAAVLVRWPLAPAGPKRGDHMWLNGEEVVVHDTMGEGRFVVVTQNDWKTVALCDLNPLPPPYI